MKRSDTRIHQTELLLTLDYLLNYTDKDHPAMQTDICRHARNYGLKYEDGKPGDDVKRQRIGDCLQFLQYVCYKFKDRDQIPFIINTTESGKFYLVEKNHLNEDQIIKILAAVMNDKYTQDEDTDLLITKLLYSFSNSHNRLYLKDEVNKLNKGVKKYNFHASRNIRLVNKAYKEGKTIRIRHEIICPNRKDIYCYDSLYRVYKIKEYKNKPYAILLPVSEEEDGFFHSILFDAIENLNIPKGKDSDVVFEDYEKHRDLNKLFAKCNKSDFRYYGDIDKMLEANVMPQGGFAFVISFYFSLEFERIIKQSYEDFFSQPLKYVKCASFDVLEEKQSKTMLLPHKNDNGIIVPHELNNGEEPKYGVANVSLNVRAFQSWVLSDPYGDSYIDISDMITIVGPTFVKEHLANYYSRHLIKFKDYLYDKTKIDTINKLQDK